MKTKLPTFEAIVIKYMVLTPAIFSAALLALAYLGANLGAALLFPVAILPFIAIIDYVRFMPRLQKRKNRAQRVAAVMPNGSYKVKPVDTAMSPLFESLEARDIRTKTLYSMTGDGWSFFDFQFDIEIVGVGGSKEFMTSSTVYSVVKIPLSRQLPHIFFDSKHMRGRQMRYNFDSGQKIHLEGNFSTYFDTYFPASYELDLLSIITPEVMEALMAAQSFDIEIYYDSIYLYSPMLDPHKIPHVIQLGTAIRDKLMNNTKTYSDNRLAVDARKAVHINGQTIQDNFRLRALYTLTVSLLLLALTLWLSSQLHLLASLKDHFTINMSIALTGLLALLTFAASIDILVSGYREKKARRSNKAHKHKP